MTNPNTASLSPLKGVGMTVLATAFFATLDTSMQYVAHTIPVVMALWARYLIQVSVTSGAVYRIEGHLLPRAKEKGLQLLRGIAYTLTSIFAFTSLRYISVGEFTAILMLTPVVVSVCAAMLFHEKVRAIRWVLLLLSFAGTLVIVRPGSNGVGWGLLFPLATLVTNTCFLLVTARLSSKDSPMSTHFYSGLVGVAIMAALLPWNWRTEIPLQMWLVFAVGAIAATCGHMLLINAYRYASAGVLVPFMYCQLAFATLGGWLVFDKAPDALVFVGMALIVTSGITGAWITKKEQETSSKGQKTKL